MILHVDCTLRDGGYYNEWDFSHDLILRYIEAMTAIRVDVIELGFRSLHTSGFRGALAYTTDDFVRSLPIPTDITIGVMINASEVVGAGLELNARLEKLFPEKAADTPVSLVRIASHFHEYPQLEPTCRWLKSCGFNVGINLMQASDRTPEELAAFARDANEFDIDVLYFADSLGSLTPSRTREIVGLLREDWRGPIGIHTHDNQGMALQNTLVAVAAGVSWVDSTITGMGRGPGNARTEELIIEVTEMDGRDANLVPLVSLVQKDFEPMQRSYGWGTNPFYYLAGKYGIHPTYIQSMLSDSRYDNEDVFAVIDHLRSEGGKQFSGATLDAARAFFNGSPEGNWIPADVLRDREVLIVGAGPGAQRHRLALESYIRRKNPYVLALNTDLSVDPELIQARVACHPIRLRADCDTHLRLPQPLITPASMFPDYVKTSLREKQLFDFGLRVSGDTFEFHDNYCNTPTPLVAAYALAIASSGRASNILLAGFDGYGGDDPRTQEMRDLFTRYFAAEGAVQIAAVTPTTYNVPVESIYAL